jgi:uncharacterized protein
MTVWSVTAEGLRIALRVTPKARRAGIGAVVGRPDGMRLEVAVSAAPEDGKANAAVVALLAEALGVARRQVRIIQGAASRQKLVAVDGDGPALAARLEALLSADGRQR